MTHRPSAPPTGELPTLESAHALEAVPGYTLVRFLGEGTMARAYECRQDRTGELVVLKVLTAAAAADRGAAQRTLRESRVIAGLRTQPHIGRVLDVGESPAGPFVALERLAGTDLRTVLVQHGRLPVAEALAAVRDAARALDAAAHVGVAHRDVKPANLFRVPEQGGLVKLTDFGFAPPLSRLGGPVGVYGTPAFIAPELLKGAPSDVRTDIYALGATLFQLVTARPLFEGNTADVLAAHQKKPVPSIATLVPDAGIAVVDVLYRLLNKDPQRRPQTAGEVVGLLEEAMGRKRTSTLPPTLGVGAGPGGARPAPSEPQWATMGAPPPQGAAPSAGAMPATPATPMRGGASPFDEQSDAAYIAQPTGVLGTLKQMGVSDILQMLEIGKKSARLDVQIEGANAVVHVHDGQIVYARLDRVSGLPLQGRSGPGGGPAGSVAGEAAVVTLCRKKEGFFRIHYEKEAVPEQNVTKPTQFVLLEAMRQIDEAAQESALEDAPAGAVALPVQPAPSSSAAGGRPAQPLPRLATPLARPGGARAPASSGAAFESPAATWPEPPPAKHDRTRENSSSRPRPLAGEGMGDVTTDGIERGDANDATMAVPLDDPTMPEAPTAKRRAVPDLGAVAEIGQRLGRRLGRGTAAFAAHAADVADGVARRAAHGLEPLRPRLAALHPRLGEAPPLAVVGAVIGVFVALVVAVAALATGAQGTGYEDGLEAIFDGDAAAVVDELEGVPPAERTLDQDLVLGHAYAALGFDGRALELYRIALPVRADVFSLAVLLSRLDASAPDEEIDLLVLWPDDEADEQLALLTVDPRPLVRLNAAAILVERGTAGLVDVEQTALLDFVQAQTCPERRIALATLRVAGKSQVVLDAVDRLGRAHESCFGVSELRGAYAAIKRRL